MFTPLDRENQAVNPIIDLYYVCNSYGICGNYGKVPYTGKNQWAG